MPQAACRLNSRLLAVHGPLPLLLAVVLGLAVGLATPVAPALAAGPTGEYVPQHVWQMHNNCVWAAGEMLLDKWTHGSVRIRQSVLERASGDKKGGSSLYDLSRAVGRLTGLRLSFSPGYGDTMSWWQLLDRIDHGGGAVLIGEYSRLPAHYTRWAKAFARRRDSAHAIYIQSYDRARGRVWLMDPLAGGDYPGEWIPVAALHRFATFEHGRVMAAATPAHGRPTAPLIDRAYRLGRVKLTGRAVAGSAIGVRVDLSIHDGFPKPPAQRFVGRWIPIVAPPAPSTPVRSRAVADAASAPGVVTPPVPVAAATASAPDRAGRRGFASAIAVPTVPGRYALYLGLTEVGQRTPSRTFPPVVVTVLPPYGAALALPKAVEAAAGAGLSIRIAVANIGTVDWRPPTPPADDPHPAVPAAQTLLVLTWHAADGTDLPGVEVPMELAPGAIARTTVNLVAPSDAGRWTLVGDIVNVDRGALSSTGWSAPSMAVLVDPTGLSAEH